MRPSHPTDPPTPSGPSAAEAIVLSQYWPARTGGAGIAVGSALRVLLHHFERIRFICLSHRDRPAETAWADDRIEWIAIPSPAWPAGARFALALASPKPAITLRYRLRASRVGRTVQRLVSAASAAGRASALVLTDVPIAVLLEEVSRRVPELPVAMLSQNVLRKAYGSFTSYGPRLQRLLWRYELARIRRFEAWACRETDRLWPITTFEAQEYDRLVGARADGTIGVVLDEARYRDVPRGDAGTIISLGTADLRKGRGLRAFLREVWPALRTRAPGARLVLGGRGMDEIATPGASLDVMGFIDDDREFLGLGRVFVNPQRIGAGLQIKSAIAMLAGKALVSFPTGLEGTPGRHGEHFVRVDDADQMVGELAALVADPARSAALGERARQLAARTFSEEQIVASAGPSVAGFVREVVSRSIRAGSAGSSPEPGGP